MRQHAVVASGELRVAPRTVAMASLGSVIGGRFEFGGLTYDVTPGPVIGAAIGHRFVDGQGSLPFVLGTLSIAASFVQTRFVNARDRFTATDARIGVVVGKTFGPVSPYVLARGFGGPIFWNELTGSDRYHYNLGLGLALGPFGGVDVGAEVSLLGERRATASAGLNF